MFTRLLGKHGGAAEEQTALTAEESVLSAAPRESSDVVGVLWFACGAMPCPQHVHECMLTTPEPEEV